MTVSVISMPSENLMREYLKKGIWGDEYRPGRPLHNWVRYWVKPGEEEKEIDYLYLKDHLDKPEKGRADIMFSPWMLIQAQLQLNGETWYKRDILSGKLNAQMLEQKLPYDEYPRLKCFLELAYTRANMWVLPEARMQRRGLFPMVTFTGNGEGLGRRVGKYFGGCCDHMPATIDELYYCCEILKDPVAFSKENALQCFFEGGIIERDNIKPVPGYDTQFRLYSTSQKYLDAYIEYAIARIEERERELQEAEANGWKVD